MLQLSNLELTDFVDAEIEQNPLLERREPTAEEASPAAAPAVAEEIVPAALPETLQNDFAPDAAEHWHAAAGAEGDGSVDFGGEPQAWRSRNGALGSEDRPGFEQTAARPRTLREHVLEQIGDRSARAGRPADRAAPARPARRDGLSARRARRAWRCCSAALSRGSRRCWPGSSSSIRPAFSPATCRNAWRSSCAIATGSTRRCRPCSTICRCWPARNIAALMRVCQVDAEDVAEMIAEIKSLDPRPGLAFDPPLAQPVVPDILMRAQPEGGWIVELNTDTLPRVLVNNRYYAQVSRAARNKAEARLPDRPAAGGELAGQVAAPARHHDPQGRRRDRPPAGRVLPPRGAVAAAADPARHRRSHRHARKHGQPGDQQQVHGDAARGL